MSSLQLCEECDHAQTDVNNRKKVSLNNLLSPEITLNYQGINLDEVYGLRSYKTHMGDSLSGTGTGESPAAPPLQTLPCIPFPPWEVIIELALGRRACFSSPRLHRGGRSSNCGEHKGFVQEGEGKHCTQSTDYCTAVVVYFD